MKYLVSPIYNFFRFHVSTLHPLDLEAVKLIKNNSHLIHKVPFAIFWLAKSKMGFRGGLLTHEQKRLFCVPH